MIISVIIGTLVGIYSLNFSMNNPAIFNYSIANAVGFAIVPALIIGFGFGYFEFELLWRRIINKGEVKRWS